MADRPTALTIKICGLSTAATLDAALAAGADMVGLVFFPKSPRNVTPDAAAPLAARARGRAETVALVVDADDALLAAIAETVAPDWYQLHGRETPERVAEVRARFGRPVMKAVGIATADDLDRAAAFAGVADRLLFDAKPPPAADRPGGNGVSFDWDMLARELPRRLDPVPSFMLSGGLGIANVGDAVARTRPFGIDVSSGVERAPGEKDEDMIAAFVAAARAAESGVF